MVDFRGPSAVPIPHRKPIPAPNTGSRHDLRPLTKIHPDTDFNSTPPHTVTTTTTNTSYSPFPPRSSSHNTSSSPASNQSPYNNPMFTSRRTPSQSTTSSTTHTYTHYPPSRTPSNVSSKISRTSSTRSGASIAPTSYVALMRKQKATVWCDRAQPEDPRILAQQKAAKVRAGREINGLVQGKIPDGRTSTSGSMGSGSLGVRSKIRHHGVPKASGYNSANMSGGGVPMRLSANEVGDDGTYNAPAGGGPGQGQSHSLAGSAGGRGPMHHRTNSGQSSVRDSRFLTVDTQQTRRLSQGSTPISAVSGGISELEEPKEGDYSEAMGQPKSAGGSSSERENSFGKVGEMAPPVPAKDEMKKKSADLGRRDSVEVRQNSGLKLFIANPDTDSD